MTLEECRQRVEFLGGRWLFDVTHPVTGKKVTLEWANVGEGLLRVPNRGAISWQTVDIAFPGLVCENLREVGRG